MLQADGDYAEGSVQSTGYGAYRRIQTETSSPGELLLMLYDALANDLLRASEGLSSGDHELAHTSLVRAQDIVMELVASLDLNSGNLARELSALYQYFYERLVHANVEKDLDAIREVHSLVTPIREAWTQAVQSSNLDRATARPGTQA
jgi:flagellar secretion chaperone FliS